MMSNSFAFRVIGQFRVSPGHQSPFELAVHGNCRLLLDHGGGHRVGLVHTMELTGPSGEGWGNFKPPRVQWLGWASGVSWKSLRGDPGRDGWGVRWDSHRNLRGQARGAQLASLEEAERPAAVCRIESASLGGPRTIGGHSVEARGG